METSLSTNHYRHGRRVFWLCMLFMSGCLQWVQAQSAPERRFSVQVRAGNMSAALKQLQDASGVHLSYNENEVEQFKAPALQISNETIHQALARLFKGTPLESRTLGGGVAIYTRKTAPPVVTKTISGRVFTGKDNVPTPGVTVTLKGTGKGTTTDAAGQYSLTVPEGKTSLIFSFIGMSPKEVTAGNGPLDVYLQDDVKGLEQVVVVGYGEVKKKDLTGVVASVRGEDIQNANVSNFNVALAGRAPGVLVTKTTGAPGAEASIRIRGNASLSGINDPLYVIDDVPMEVRGANTGMGNFTSPLSMINPQDIESIDILKDASAAAIYGSRAANGVVIVKTKRGRSGGGTDFNFSYTHTFEDFAKSYQPLSSKELKQVWTRAFNNVNVPVVDTTINTRWADEVTRVAQSNTYNLGINGGTQNGKTIYSVSLSLDDRPGVIKETSFKRYNVRSRLEALAFDKLKLAANINYSRTENLGTGTSAYYNLVGYRPDVPIYNADGTFGSDKQTTNPVGTLKQPSRSDNKNMLLAFSGEYELIKGLRFKSSLSYTFEDGEYKRYIPSWDVFEAKNGRKGNLSLNSTTSLTRAFENTLSYDRLIGNHKLNLLAGASYNYYKNEGQTIKAINFPNDNVLNILGAAQIIDNWKSNGSISGLESYLFRANYSFNGKYYATFTGRADKSTKFAPGRQWGVFPSGALSWRISEEEFLKHHRNIDEIKLRASIGKTGTASFPDFLYRTFFSPGNYYDGINGLKPGNVPNSNMQWETTSQLDAGVDYSFLKGKIFGSLNFYRKFTKDVIVFLPIPLETGFTNQSTNLGDIMNRGVEFQIGVRAIQQKDFSWTTDFNISHNKGYLAKFNGGYVYGNLREGESLGTIYGYKTNGLFQRQEDIDALNKKSPLGYYQSARTAPGDIHYVDVNGDGMITSDDGKEKIGDAEPVFFGGWNNDFRYRNFQLTVFFSYSVGNDLYNQGGAGQWVYSTRKNYDRGILGAWSPTNTAATLPRLDASRANNNDRNSDVFVSDASFVKLKMLQLSYVINNDWFKRIHLKNVRVTASASNLFVITRYAGLDPEVNTSPSPYGFGIDNNIYPQTKSYAIGLNVNF